jgi:hypothetical protein
VNDREFEDLVTLATANDLETDVPEVFKAAIRKRSPLAQTIDTLLARRSKIAARRNLEALSSLNQGRLEDLNAPEFRSYVMAKTGMTESDLEECVSEIELFRRLSEAMAQDEPIAMAARDEEGFGKEQIAASELLERLAETDEG